MIVIYRYSIAITLIIVVAKIILLKYLFQF